MPSQNGSITDLNNRVTALEQPGFLTVNCDTPDSDLQSAINNAPEGTVDARAFRQTISRFTAADHVKTLTGVFLLEKFLTTGQAIPLYPDCNMDRKDSAFCHQRLG